MSKKILVINLGWEQQPIIKSLQKRGYRLYGITNDPNRDQDGFEEVYTADYRDLDKIYELATKIKPDAVISDQCDYSHYAQAFVSERLNLKGPKLSAAQVSSNKFIQRTKAKEEGVLIPNFKLAQNYDEAYKAAHEIGFPIIIKPIDNRGSFGVSKVNTAAELKDAYYTALVNSHSRFILIEQFIDGYEITIDGYCFDGKPKSLSVALKSKEGLTSQVSMDIKYPADIPETIYEKALKNNDFTANALGYTFGMVHSEYLVDKEDNIYLVESANRGGGVFTSELIVPKVCGVNILDRYIDDIIGIDSSISTPSSIEQNPVLLKFFAFKNGKIKSITGIEDVINQSGVMACRLNIKVGDTIKTIDNDGSRHGFVIYHSNKDIRNEVSEIINMIQIEYEHG